MERVTWAYWNNLDLFIKNKSNECLRQNCIYIFITRNYCLIRHTNTSLLSSKSYWFPEEIVKDKWQPNENSLAIKCASAWQNQQYELCPAKSQIRQGGEERKRELVALLCLSSCVSWLLCGSSSRCHGFVCSLWLWYFLIILTYYFFFTSTQFFTICLGLNP